MRSFLIALAVASVVSGCTRTEQQSGENVESYEAFSYTLPLPATSVDFSVQGHAGSGNPFGYGTPHSTSVPLTQIYFEVEGPLSDRQRTHLEDLSRNCLLQVYNDPPVLGHRELGVERCLETGYADPELRFNFSRVSVH